MSRNTLLDVTRTCCVLVLVISGMSMLAGCMRAPIESSFEIQAGTYLTRVTTVLEEHNKLANEGDRLNSILRAADIAASESEHKRIEHRFITEVSDPFIASLRKSIAQLEDTRPPSRLLLAHKAFTSFLNQKLYLAQEIRAAVIAEDWDLVERKRTEEQDLNKAAKVQLTNSLKSAGFSSESDLARLSKIPNSSMPWIAAFIAIGFTSVFWVPLGRIMFEITALPFLVLLVLEKRSEERNRLFLSRLASLLYILFIGVCFSLAGPILAGLAERFMFPYTELAPWFVYLVMGYNALVFPIIDLTGSAGNDTGTRFFALSLGAISSLATFIWATVSKGFLFGPWQWVNQTALQWLN